MKLKFVVSHLDEQLGPFDEDELKVKWEAGEILPIDYVYDDEKEDWVLLAERFPWAAQPVAMDGSAPPPIREDTIMKRSPPSARPEAAGARGPTPAADTSPTSPVSPSLTQTSLGPVKPIVPTLKDIVSEIKYTEIAPTVKSAPAATTTSTSVAPAQNVANAATSAAPVSPKAAQIQLVNGEAEVDLSPMNPGRVELHAEDTTGSNVKVTAPLTINIKAAEPATIEWKFTTAQSVGNDVDVEIRALDNRGFQCVHYSDQYMIHVRGPVSHDVVVRLVGGYAKVTLNHTKAEKWELSLHYSGAKKVALPTAGAIEWQPGPAVRLVLDGPQEYLAGDPLKVKVKAVDAYGNLARTFHGTVVLEVKAS